MRPLVLGILSLAAVASAVPAEAQVRRVRSSDGVVVTVRPRSYLDAGRVAPLGSESRYAGGWQARSYLNTPPYQHMKDRFGEGVLPDPITNGPFVGARNPFGPVDFSGTLR
ncbi:MAG TPA: hypothetical protein VIL65_03100 [Beijerinckiaceae bacterium]|jgi:hypothetical protein